MYRKIVHYSVWCACRGRLSRNQALSPADWHDSLRKVSVGCQLAGLLYELRNLCKRPRSLVGKASFAEDKLVENIKAFTDAVNKAKPAGAKGHYINRVSISSTMGPGVKVDMATLGVGGSGGSQH